MMKVRLPRTEAAHYRGLSWETTRSWTEMRDLTTWCSGTLEELAGSVELQKTFSPYA
jgi:hypothetical protein